MRNAITVYAVMAFFVAAPTVIDPDHLQP